MITKVKPM